ncbi:hypothetical protein A1O1_04897 [Capronia coronata CBS 617.96]|uniref:Exonuclease domain-containing protein n=1 Tax=Capronia coronata CBS 617.96 TaxID=1182541 RepID=W9YE87_9EURO|nr:uncharacterized protein A1O1_04897 [Capronia coronata CBS 617.96]EXJ87970.1 hypothetical protein A1O1_04897 [Capronia coronata CBS 617.96]
MTGLNPQTDTIMSVACFLTTSDLQPLDPEGFEVVIQHTPQQLSSMSEWCVRTHGSTGLTQRCLASTTTAQVAADALLAYIKRYIPEPGRALLAGNSIHADKAFLMIPPWNVVLEHLHYRLFDVSAMKEMVRRWARPEVLESAPLKQLRHSAREDVLESIEEARYYKMLIEGSFMAGGNVTSNSNVTGIEAGANTGNQQQQRPAVAAAADDITSGDGDMPPAATAPATRFITSRDQNDNTPLPASSSSPLVAGTRHGHGKDYGGGGFTKGAGTEERHGNLGGSDREGASASARTPPALSTKQGQEAVDMMRNNGTRTGDVGGLDAGFRTDVP